MYSYNNILIVIVKKKVSHVQSLLAQFYYTEHKLIKPADKDPQA